MTDIFQGLNSRQREAVEATEPMMDDERHHEGHQHIDEHAPEIPARLQKKEKTSKNSSL